MAKILVEDREEHTKVPFLRGILIRSLQDAGMPFEDALQLATEIRSDLGDMPSITTSDLRDTVLRYLIESQHEGIASRYEKQKIPLDIWVEQRDGQILPFSRLEYQQCLETISIESEEAGNVVATIYNHLVDRHTQHITSRRLAHLTYRYLRQSAALGPAVANRWLVWRDFVNSGRPLILLIGGAPGCGKSTTATMLASRLDIVRTQSTDMLREVMRTMIPEQLLPVLHHSSFAAWKALPGKPGMLSRVSEALLVQGYRSQADLLSVAIEAVIQRALRERVSLILEGVHVHPSFIAELKDTGDAVVIPIMLGVLKRKQLQRRIRGRGTASPQRRSERYLEYFDEIWHLQSYLLSEADRTNTPIVINSDRSKVFREIMRIIIDHLARDFDSKPEAVFA
ncbi:MAG: zeta toxin family protein [Gammaproteobacteria bacterium]|jgi:2-phosphoglycerate kinase